MSTLKLTNLQHASAASPAIVLDANSRATLNGLSYPTEGSLSGRNRIINGDMRIDQRNAGASVTGNVYTLDRWQNFSDVGATYTIQQVTDAPTGFTNSLKLTVSTGVSPAAGKQSVLSQAIEGFNVADLGFGSASAQAITLSFWVKSSAIGTHAGNLQNAVPNRDYVFTYTINSSNTWEYKTITISGDTTGTWGTGNGVGIGVYFNLGSNTTSFGGTANTWSSSILRTTAGAVQLMGTTGATWQVTGVQLEAGSVATPFERRSYGQELMLAMRYYQRYQATAGYTPSMLNGKMRNSTLFESVFTMPVTMRSAPTLTATNSTNAWYVNTAADGNANTVTLNGASTQFAYLNATTTGLSAGQAATFVPVASGTYFDLSAEL